jgi:tryptophan synthase alpha chain
MAAVETALRAARAAGRPILITYVTAGIRDHWTDLLTAMIDAGADAVEIGLPFSDPMLDGVTIQEASTDAIARGASTRSILAQLGAVDAAVPLITMTYANHVYSRGVHQFCSMLADAGVAGSVIPDLPLDEAEEYLDAAKSTGIDATLMITPVTPTDRVAAVCQRSRGFVYAMSVMATTGTTTTPGQAGWDTATRARTHSDRPVLIGFGIDTPDLAAQAAQHADGVIVASALMRSVLDGAPVSDVARSVSDLRAALDRTAA